MLPNSPPALPNNYQTQDEQLTNAFDELPNQLPNPATATKQRRWRSEVIKRGVYWIWRRGTAENREWRKGGKFGELDEQRQIDYQTNVSRRANAKAKRQAKSASAVTGSIVA